MVCPLYGGCPYLGESIMGGSTVLCKETVEHKLYIIDHYCIIDTLQPMH